MTIAQFIKIESLIKQANTELQSEAVASSISVVSPEFDKLLARAKELILKRMGFTVEEYTSARLKVTTLSSEDTLAEIEKINKDIQSIREAKILTTDEVAAIAESVAKSYIKPPQIIHQIVKETTVPQIVKETTIEKIVEERAYNEKPLQESIGALSKRVDEIKQIDVPALTEDLKGHFSKSLEKNIDMLGMPNFRKLAMGMQGQIDDLRSNAGGSITVADIDGTPSVTHVTAIKFSNGSVTDNGDGTVNVTTGSGGGGDVSSNTASSVDSEVALFSGTGGKTIKRATGSGIATLTSGVLSATATTGSGSVVLATSPTLVTPALGVATATSVNGTTIPSSKTLVVTTDKISVLAATTSAELAGVISDETGTGALVFASSPTLVTPALGTPSALVGTNISGTAAGLTAGTVTTNANLTGPITSSGNATSIASQTGTGTKFVVDTSPTLVTPTIGVATATSVNKMAITAPATSSTLAVADGKTFTASNTITLTGTDGVSMNVTNSKLHTVGFTIDGGGSAITTGKVKGFFICPFAGSISAWNFVVDAGTATVKVWKIATGTAKPTSANSINTSGVAIATGTAIRSTTLSDFTSTTVTANDIFGFNVESVGTATEMTFQLEIIKT